MVADLFEHMTHDSQSRMLTPKFVSAATISDIRGECQRSAVQWQRHSNSCPPHQDSPPTTTFTVPYLPYL